MSDASAAAALRSPAAVVVIEAPAGCGKTFQAASFASDFAPTLRPGRMLILTHTHAACDVIAKRTAGIKEVEIRTIDSLVIEIASAYHRVMDLPPDVSRWAREKEDGYDQVAARTAALLARSAHIATALARRYPVVVCDEHQDSSTHQHCIVLLLGQAGARLRFFGDPMQSIYTKNGDFAVGASQWTNLCKAAHAVETLDVGHRWKKTAPALGEWIQAARAALKGGGSVDLSGKRPSGLHVFRADNRAYGYGNYRLDYAERKPIDDYVKPDGQLLVLAAQNKTVGSLRGVFARRLPIWEGHTRNALDILVRAISQHAGNPTEIGGAMASFVGHVAVGFTRTEFGDRLLKEIKTGCTAKCRGKPAVIQTWARMLLAEPNHRGIAAALKDIAALAADDPRFVGIKVDHPREFREAIQLGGFADLVEAHAEVTRRRGILRPTPPAKAISTVHKAKGLECDRVLVVPCDNAHFADKPEHRCLLYVALSRPVKNLALVVPAEPSPLLKV